MDPKSHFLTVGNPIVGNPIENCMDGSVTARLRLVLYRVSYSKEMRLLGHFFWEVRGSRSLDLEGCCDFDLRIKSIRPGISSSLLVPNIVARESIAAEKKKVLLFDDT